MFSDLETDYLNPIDFCNKMNQVFTLGLVSVVCTNAILQFVLPEIIAHAFLTLCFLLSGQWISLLLNAPLLAINVNKYVMSRPVAS